MENNHHVNARKEAVMARTITREELKEKIDAVEDFVLIDVLSHESYQREHLPGAVNIPLGDIAEHAVAGIPSDKEIVVYCGSFLCTASPTAAKKLEEMGFSSVIDYEGGIADWKEAGYPVEAGAKRLSQV
jgi:rhodanese-related sulfurtransferase